MVSLDCEERIIDLDNIETGGKGSQMAHTFVETLNTMPPVMRPGRLPTEEKSFERQSHTVLPDICPEPQGVAEQVGLLSLLYLEF